MDKVSEEIGKVLESKTSARILKIIAACIVALLIFSAGIAVGFHKASFGRAWGEHYNENFGIGNKGPFIPGVYKMGMMDDFPNANGAIGKIIKIELPNIIVQGDDNVEKAILINSDTKIQKGNNLVQPTDLKIDDFVVVIGTPNPQGLIEAKLIRIIPAPQFLNQLKIEENHV